MLEPDRAALEKIVAEAEAKAQERRRADSAPDRPARLRTGPDAASSLVLKTLALTDADRAELDRLGREHDAALRRLAEEERRRAIERSAEASDRLAALAASERAALDAVPADDWRNPWVPSWPPVYFIRSTPGASIVDSHLEEARSWAKWRCTTDSISGDSEKLSFYHLWQNPKDSWALADVSVRLIVLGHFECSAEGWGVPAGWFTESRSEAELSARLAVWPLWLPHDDAQQPQFTVRLARLVATAGVFSDTESTSIDQSVLVRTVRYAVPANGFILIEAAVALDHSGGADVDLASGDFRVQAPYCFVTLPTDVNMNL